jgi:hypothetical protein
MPTPSPSNVVLGRGSLLFDRFTSAGVKTGYRHLGNCDTFSVNTATDSITLKDFTQQTTAPYVKAITSTDITLNIQGFEFDTDNLALILLGTTQQFTQSAGSVTNEIIAPTTYVNVKGKFFRTLAPKITGVVVKWGATTLILGTDYQIVNANLGIIQILSTSPTVVDGTVVTVDYTRTVVTAATDIKQVLSGVVAEVVGQLLFVPNNSVGPNQSATFWKVSMTPNGEFGFISEEFNKWTLQGTVLSDAAGVYGGSVASPYYTMQDVK